MDRIVELDPVDQALIDLLMDGETVVDAARSAGMSRRTAHRRLAELRLRYDATGTTHLLQRLSSPIVDGPSDTGVHLFARGHGHAHCPFLRVSCGSGRESARSGSTAASWCPADCVAFATCSDAIALADSGHQSRALRSVHDGVSRAQGDADVVGFLHWAAAEAFWLLGDPEQAVQSAEASLVESMTGCPSRPLVGTVRAWALYELGEEPAVVHEEGCEFAAAAHDESEGVRLLAVASFSQAAAAFEDVSRTHHDTPRVSLRARWGLGESHRRAGDLDAARSCWESVASEAVRHGLLPLAGRARRSLMSVTRRSRSERRRGRPPTSSICRPVDLTDREDEVLGLVAGGHTSKEIASITGIRSSTVDSHIAHAVQRLGVGSRRQGVLVRSNRQR